LDTGCGRAEPISLAAKDAEYFTTGTAKRFITDRRNQKEWEN
jgi:hypothetical protein